jgi:MSHA biogenesis protein MshQ
MRFLRAIQCVIVGLMLLAVTPAWADFGIGTCEDFETGYDGWTRTSGSSSNVGTNTVTSNSGSYSLYERVNAVTLQSPTVDLSAQASIDFTLWLRRGGSGSKKPEDDEDLYIEYLNDSGSWIQLGFFDGAGSIGQIYTLSYSLAADARHAGFAVRFRKVGRGEGYWHFDDACLSGSSTPPTIVSYSFEEDSWTGATGEIVDGEGSGADGMAVGGVTNAGASPAIATDPGTCRYGDFDGVDDYIEIADHAALDLPDTLTAAAWINMRSLPAGLHTIVSKDWNYEFHIDPGGHVYWWWNDAGGTVRSITTAQSITLDEWHHVAVVYQSGSQVIYVDGDVWATASYTGTLRLNDLPLYIGTDYAFLSRAFDGYIDEVYLTSAVLDQSDVQGLMTATHPCPVAAAQFTINHDTFGIHCLPETITIDVIDSLAGTPLLNYNAEVLLDTQNGRGTWALVSGSGSFADSVADDGLASYDWPLGESQAVFSLSYPEGPSAIDIDTYQVSDPGIRDTDAEGTLSFSANGFMLTSVALGNPPPALVTPFAAAQTAAVSFPVYLTAYGQTPEDPQCGVIESYSGNKVLDFWSEYLNPSSGSRAMLIDGVAVGAGEGAATAVAITFANGQAAVTGRYKDVGLTQIYAKDDTTVNAELPAGIRGATAGFVVRPASFELSAIENAAGTIVNPQAADASGAVFVAAGTPFRATVTALDADGDPTPNYGQETIPETVRLDTQLIAPAGGANPAVSAATGFGAFSAGIATGLDFTWPEVGIVELSPAVGDGDYLGAGDVVGVPSERVGRFVPDHFAVALNTPILETACTAGSFSYVGEAVGYLAAPVITATAQAAGGTVTANYRDDFFKLATATLANRQYSATETLDLSGVPAAAIDPAVTVTGPGVAELAFSPTTSLSFLKTAVIAPFAADIALSIDVLDADGVAASANPVTFGVAGGMLFSAGAEMRYGRLRFANAVGSELVDLAVPLRAEYYAGATIGFTPNTDDSCTTGVTLALTGFTENLGSGDTCALDSGLPGASNIGCAAPAPLPRQYSEPPLAGDLNLTLAAPGAGRNGSVIVTSTVPDYLRFDWDAGSAGDENPSGQATFGIFVGEGRQIYLREIY